MVWKCSRSWRPAQNCCWCHLLALFWTSLYRTMQAPVARLVAYFTTISHTIHLLSFQPTVICKHFESTVDKYSQNLLNLYISRCIALFTRIQVDLRMWQCWIFLYFWWFVSGKFSDSVSWNSNIVVLSNQEWMNFWNILLIYVVKHVFPLCLFCRHLMAESIQFLTSITKPLQWYKFLFYKYF